MLKQIVRCRYCHYQIQGSATRMLKHFRDIHEKSYKSAGHKDIPVVDLTMAEAPYPGESPCQRT